MSINENDIEFINQITDGRNHWQDIIIKNSEVIIGAICDRTQGVFEEMITKYQVCVPDTPSNREYANSETEDEGYIFVQFGDLSKFLDYYNLTIDKQNTTV
jgi:hypothetical protein